MFFRIYTIFRNLHPKHIYEFLFPPSDLKNVYTNSYMKMVIWDSGSGEGKWNQTCAVLWRVVQTTWKSGFLKSLPSRGWDFCPNGKIFILGEDRSSQSQKPRLSFINYNGEMIRKSVKITRFWVCPQLQGAISSPKTKIFQIGQKSHSRLGKKCRNPDF